MLLQLANKEEIKKMSDDKIAVGDKHKESEDQHSHGAQEIACGSGQNSKAVDKTQHQLICVAAVQFSF